MQNMSTRQLLTPILLRHRHDLPDRSPIHRPPIRIIQLAPRPHILSTYNARVISDFFLGRVGIFGVHVPGGVAVAEHGGEALDEGAGGDEEVTHYVDGEAEEGG